MNIDLEIDRIKLFVDKGNYHAALNIALSALNESHRNNNQADVDLFIGIINRVVLDLSDKFGSKTEEESLL